MLQDGFLGYRTSFMLDFVVCALILVVPLMLYSLWLVKIQKNYTAHKRLQVTLGFILLFAVGAFEVDLQMVHGGWENIVAKSFADAESLAAKVNEARPYLWVHLVFAVTTPLVWFTTLTLALRRFASPPVPGPHSRTHKTLGWLSTLDLTLTAVTGLVFYYIAFMTR